MNKINSKKTKVIISPENVVDFCFDELSNYPDEVQDMFYIDRSNVNSLVIEALRNCALTGKSLCLVGDPGVGKTTFINKLIENGYKNLRKYFQKYTQLKKYDIIFLHIDCLQDIKLKGQDIKIFKEAFINEYLTKADKEYPCYILKDEKTTIEEKYSYLVQHIIDLDDNYELKHKIFFFIDDIDYCEQNFQHKLLEAITRFISSEKIVIIYACRSQALKEIDNHLNQRPKIDLVKKTTHIKLRPIEVRTILSSRLAFLLHKEAIKSMLSFIKFSPINKNSFLGYVKKFGVYGDDIEGIEYPFTVHQEAYISKFSNGDIRIILMIARKYLKYIITNIKKLKKEPMGGYIIERKAKIDILSVAPRKNTEIGIDAEKWKIIDLHSEKSLASKEHPDKRNNSTYQNVLEAIAILNDPYDELFYEILIEMGHSKKQIDDALNYLYWQNMIREVVIMNAGPTLFGKYSNKTNTRFNPTEKGWFYLDELIEWHEYKEKFGESAQSVYDRLDFLGKDQNSLEVLEFIATICTFCDRKKGNYIKINKNELFNFFMRKFGERYSKVIFIKNNITQSINLMNIDRFTAIMKRLKIISTYKLNERNFYAIKLRTAIEYAANEPNIILLINLKSKEIFNDNIFTHDEIKIFIDTNVTFISE